LRKRTGGRCSGWVRCMVRWPSSTTPRPIGTACSTSARRCRCLTRHGAWWSRPPRCRRGRRASTCGAHNRAPEFSPPEGGPSASWFHAKALLRGGENSVVGAMDSAQDVRREVPALGHRVGPGPLEGAHPLLDPPLSAAPLEIVHVAKTDQVIPRRLAVPGGNAVKCDRIGLGFGEMAGHLYEHVAHEMHCPLVTRQAAPAVLDEPLDSAPEGSMIVPAVGVIA